MVHCVCVNNVGGEACWVVGQHSTAFYACGQSLFLSCHFCEILAFICWFV